MKSIKWYLLTFIVSTLFGLWLHSTYLCDDNVITVYDSTVVEIPVDVPIPYDSKPNWNQYDGTHILEISYKELIDLIEKYGFKLDKRVDTYAQFKRR